MLIFSSRSRALKKCIIFYISRTFVLANFLQNNRILQYIFVFLQIFNEFTDFLSRAHKGFKKNI